MFSCGNNVAGQLGRTGSTLIPSAITQGISGAYIKQVVAGGGFSLALAGIFFWYFKE